MHKFNKYLPFLLLLAGLSLLAASCGGETITVTVPVEIPVTVEVPVAPEGPETPFLDAWSGSGHADSTAEAFNHWNEDGVVSASCAKCHSTYGYQDFLGVDGSEFGVVDADAEIGSTIECVACHNDVTLTMTSVTMPSGLELTGLGDESRCMQCHQGRESTLSVNEKLAEVGVGDDEVSEDLGFINVHYFAAAATKYGTLAKGGYEYEGKSYDAKFAHVDGYQSCIDCHDPHTLEVKVEDCKGCHTNVETVDDLKNNRMNSSLVDYDGDGDTTEGIYYEMEGMRELLYQAIQSYAADVAGSPIVYDEGTHPYFFIDSDGDGAVTEGEAVRDNAYVSWTPRLVRAAYNYQFSLKDPGAFAHGGKYVIELMYDSIEDLNQGIDIASLNRIDAGHFAGSEEAFRHWDEDGEVSSSCSRCHSAEGLPLYLAERVTIPQEPSNGFQCATCHDDLSEYTRHEAGPVTFPSGAVVDSGDPNTNLCMTCHQGRESTVSVDKAIADLPLDEVSDSLRFINVHYFAAGATRNGGDAMGAYQYAGQDYIGFFEHAQQARQCTQCHDPHELTVNATTLCANCHEGIESTEDLQTIRAESTPDYDGDGDTTEGLAGEVAGVHEKLLAAIQAYATEVTGTNITYDPGRYPYWFDDAGESFASWTPRLLQAAYNFQYVEKDPGAFAHNGRYVIQAMYDSIMSLASQVTVDTAGLIRPEIEE